jgi:pyridoxal phosphate enzyme (YggS family)
LNDYGYIERNLRSVRERLAAAAARRGNPVPELIGVTKSAEPNEVLALAALGLKSMAENRVQLLRERLELVSTLEHPPVFDLIGSLQTNKCKYVVGAVRLIESLDSLRLASELDRIARLRGVTVQVLVEVNSAREEAKGGLLPEQVLDFTSELSAFPALSVRGLMTMGPATREKDALRECFRETRALWREASHLGLFSADAAPVLSMGMSESYEIASEEGATAVRVGRALFARDEY